MGHGCDEADDAIFAGRAGGSPGRTASFFASPGRNILISTESLSLKEAKGSKKALKGS
jgi:hypothetical protein